MNTQDLPPRPFAPTAGDIRATRAILQHNLKLPTELVLQILDQAKYWTGITTERIDRVSLVDEHWDVRYSAAEPYLWIPLHLGAHPDSGEKPALREVEFNVVSNDQGWTTERGAGPYETSSWFEVTRCRPRGDWTAVPSLADAFVATDDEVSFANVEQARRFVETEVEFVPRPSQEMEAPRLHCPEMRKVTWPRSHREKEPELDEGTHAWYLQGNQVARATSLFEGEMVKRYRVIWGCKANPRWEGNEGAGRGEGFVDSLREGDRILVWARAKRRGWENHVWGMRVVVRYTI